MDNYRLIGTMPRPVIPYMMMSVCEIAIDGDGTGDPKVVMEKKEPAAVAAGIPRQY